MQVLDILPVVILVLQYLHRHDTLTLVRSLMSSSNLEASISDELGSASTAMLIVVLDQVATPEQITDTRYDNVLDVVVLHFVDRRNRTHGTVDYMYWSTRMDIYYD